MAQPIRTKSHDSRKREHAAFVLPVFGALLLLPPLINLLGGPQRLFGVPVKIVYLFLVWILLILGSVMISWRMPRSEKKPPDLPPGEAG